MAGGATYGYGLAQGSLRGMSSIKREALSLSPFLSSSLLLYLSISLAFNIKQEILSAFAFVIPYNITYIITPPFVFLIIIIIL